MRSWLQVQLSLLTILILTNAAQAGNKDSLQLVYQQFLQQREKGVLSDSTYLHQIDSLVFLSFDQPSFPQLMEPYRQLVFSSETFRERRIIYFQYRGIHAVNNHSTGQAIFYFEKMADEAAAQKNTGRELAAHRAIISIFADMDDDEKCFQRFEKIFPLIKAQVDAAEAGRSSGILMENVSGILQLIIGRLYRKEPPGNMSEVETLMRRIQSAVSQNPAAYAPFFHKILIALKETAFLKAAYDLKDPALAGARLNDIIRLIDTTKEMGEGMKSFFLFDEYYTGIDYFLKAGLQDSARKYLRLLNELDLPMVRDRKEQYYREQMAKLLSKDGAWKEAYLYNAMALAMKDSILKATLKDRNNNVYAQAESDFNRELLSQTLLARKQAEKVSSVLVVALGLLLPAILFALIWLRVRQQNRFLNDKLRMARNIHDEIGPMLLYIKLLAKKERELSSGNSQFLNQMDSTVNNVIETVRGLSHDLKSNEPLSTKQLYQEVKNLLHKTEALTGISYEFYYNNKEKDLNYFQYHHLRNIFNELVNNTIKHAEWSRIDAMFQVLPKKIRILYTDNGQGFEPAYEQKNGIGLANIRERVEKLRGVLDLRNNFPEGYSIEINIPFA